MSSQAVANPEELERFARDLKQFNTQLHDGMSRMQGQFTRLGETWRDQEHQNFAQEFEQTMRVLHHFMRSGEQQIPLNEQFSLQELPFDQPKHGFNRVFTALSLPLIVMESKVTRREMERLAQVIAQARQNVR